MGITTGAGNWTFTTGTKIGNVNVYSKFLSVEDMINITNGSRCGESGDYISWDLSEWKIFGNKSKIIEVEEKTLCPSLETKLFRNAPMNAEEAQHFCKRLGKSRVPVPKSVEHTQHLLDFYSETHI